MTTKQKVISLLFSVFFFSSLQLQAQNLQFNSAVFNEYGPFPGDGNQNTPFHTAQIVVGPNQVFKLNQMTATGIDVYQQSTPSSITHVYPILSVYINDMMIYNTAEGRIMLPTGTYTLTFYDQFSYLGNYKGFLSGILYDIVP